MGLIARQVEAAGIPTLCMTSALSITRAVNPPRAAFLDYPLGHTTGKRHEPELQRSILRDALAGFTTLTQPGSVTSLDYPWAPDDAWKEVALRSAPDAAASRDTSQDGRVERRDLPQYQCERDRELAEQALAAGKTGLSAGAPPDSID